MSKPSKTDQTARRIAHNLGIALNDIIEHGGLGPLGIGSRFYDKAEQRALELLLAHRHGVSK